MMYTREINELQSESSEDEIPTNIHNNVVSVKKGGV